MRCKAPIVPQCHPTASDRQRGSAPARRRAKTQIVTTQGITQVQGVYAFPGDPYAARAIQFLLMNHLRSGFFNVLRAAATRLCPHAVFFNAAIREKLKFFVFHDPFQSAFRHRENDPILVGFAVARTLACAQKYISHGSSIRRIVQSNSGALCFEQW